MTGGTSTARPVLPGAVLFMCSMNQIRSPIAAALARKMYGKRMYVRSAGVDRGTKDGFTVEVMAEIGIDMATHNPKRFGDLEDSNFDLIIPLSPRAERYAEVLTHELAIEVEYWPMPDPSVSEGTRSAILQDYRTVRDTLIDLIRARFGPPDVPLFDPVGAATGQPSLRSHSGS